MNESVWLRILRPEVAVFVIPIVAIVVGIIASTTVKIVKLVHAHNERIEMIRQGIHPDYPPENLESDTARK
jgi:hypothetical protein